MARPKMRTSLSVSSESDFSKNLRYLCSYYNSMSEVCRRVGVNRQQFNKYVAGAARPSNRNMRRICEFFGVEEFEILSPPRELRRIVELRGIRHPDDMDNYLTRATKRLIDDSDPSIRNYYGFYFTYYYSFSFPGKILMALLNLSERNGIPGYKRVERLIDKAQPTGASFVYKYEGVALYLRERIFLVDRESLTGSEISESILYPSYKNKVGRLTGLTLGTSGQTSREPICSRILLEYLGLDPDVKACMRQCGLYEPASQDLDGSITRSIDNTNPPQSFAFRAISL